MRLGPSVDPDTGCVAFVADDEGGEPLRVWYHLRRFADDPSFRKRSTRWVAEVPPPPVDRIQYLLVRRTPDAGEAMALDPANPLTVPGVFGDHSVIELPGYQEPDWVTEVEAARVAAAEVDTAEEDSAWTGEPLHVDTDVERVSVHGELMTPGGFDSGDVLPLLVVHDGPEYVRLVGLLDYLDWLGQRRESLRCRVLALQPDDRNRSYAASHAYTEALVRLAVPLARTMAPSVGPAVGLGASLGALALAHAAATHPGSFGGLYLQSGSFFLPRYDAHERRFGYFDDVVQATAHLHSAPSPLTGVRVTVTAGLGEENLENNEALAARLAELGVESRIVEGRDGHNHIAWRDLLHPGLEDLLTAVWGQATSFSSRGDPPRQSW
jgi:enterochelin esterase family protein